MNMILPCCLSMVSDEEQNFRLGEVVWKSSQEGFPAYTSFFFFSYPFVQFFRNLLIKRQVSIQIHSSYDDTNRKMTQKRCSKR